MGGLSKLLALVFLTKKSKTVFDFLSPKQFKILDSKAKNNLNLAVGKV